MLNKVKRLNSKGKWYALKLYDYMVIKKTSLFDKDYYLSTYPDVRDSNQDPLWHFVMHGAKEKRDPHQLFVTEYYLRNNQDVYASGINPLVHYIKFGDKEGRRPHPLFENIFYRAFFENKLSKKTITLEHYLKNPQDLSLRPHPLFNTSYYIENSTSYQNNSNTPLECYLNDFDKEKSSINSIFEVDSDLDKKTCLVHNDIEVEFYIKHIESDLKLKHNLIERINEFDYEGFDFLYRSTLPNAINHKLEPSVEGGLVVKAESLFEFAKANSLIVYENGIEKWESYSESLKRTIRFTMPREYICRLENVSFVAGTRLILKNNRLLHDEISTYDHSGEEYGVKLWNYTKAIDRNTFEILNTKKNKNAIIKKGILLSCDHDNNYFHWMVECIAKVLLIKDHLKYYGYPILVSKSLHKNLIVALRHVVGFEYPIFELDEGTIYTIDELIVPSDVSRILDKYSGEYNAEIDVALSKKWVKRVKEEFHLKNDVIPYRKLYLTRKTGTYRKLMNEEQIEIELLKKGFEIIDLSNSSVEFQLALFNQANIIVAPTGATITNMLLVPAKSKFIILTSDHEGVHFNLWEQLADICEVDIANCVGSRMFNRQDFHDDYEIDVSGLLEMVK